MVNVTPPNKSGQVLIGEIVHAMAQYPQGIVIKTDGTIQPFDYAAKKPTLKEMQAVVGGLIEIVRIPLVDFFMIVDEEGLLKEKEINWHGCTQYRGTTPIVGDAIFINRKLVD